VRRTLIAALTLFAGAITLDRVGLSAGDHALSSHAYAVAAFAVTLPLLSGLARRASPPTPVVAALAGYAVWSFLIAAGPFGDGPVHLVAAESGFVALAATLGARLGRSLAGLGDLLAASASGDSPAIDLEGPVAAAEIQTELARSRRHDRPVSVTVLAPSPNGLESALEHATAQFDRAVHTRFLYGSLARTVAAQLRRSDLLFEHRPSGRLVVLSPETDDAGTNLLIRRILGAADRAGIALRAGSAAFPYDGIGFEALVEHAETRMIETEEPVLRAVERGEIA
jgi:hypothetical protein